MRTKPSRKTTSRELFSLPHELATKLRKYADRYRDGNKSGFVADAIESYIARLQHEHRRSQLRQSYKAAAEDTKAIYRDWSQLEAPWPKA